MAFAHNGSIFHTKYIRTSALVAFDVWNNVSNFLFRIALITIIYKFIGTNQIQAMCYQISFKVRMSTFKILCALILKIGIWITGSFFFDRY